MGLAVGLAAVGEPSGGSNERAARKVRRFARSFVFGEGEGACSFRGQSFGRRLSQRVVAFRPLSRQHRKFRRNGTRALKLRHSLPLCRKSGATFDVSDVLEEVSFKTQSPGPKPQISGRGPRMTMRGGLCPGRRASVAAHPELSSLTPRPGRDDGCVHRQRADAAPFRLLAERSCRRRRPEPADADPSHRST